MTLIKICGITDLENALAALEAGADLLGFVFAPSRRRIAPEQAAELLSRCRLLHPPERRLWHAVGVFANQPIDFVRSAADLCHLDIVQLSGQEPPDYCQRLPFAVFKTVHLGDTSPSHLASVKAACRATRLLLDSGGSGRWGGTGETFCWESIGEAASDCLVAGGITPNNVAEAIELMRPWGVDVSSGVERDGRKDPQLIRDFITAVRRADEYPER